MTGSITNIEQLEKWFRAGNLPFFSLKYAGTGDKTIFRNEVWEDMEDAWEQLRNQVEAQASAGRAMLEILVYKKGSANHPLRTNVDIRPGYYPAQAGISGPGMYPQMGIGNVQEYVTKEVRIAMLERDNEDLRNEINNPANTWERILDKVSESPNLAGIAQTFIALLASKFGAATPMMTPVNGTPLVAQEGEEYPDAMFENLETAAGLLGSSPEAVAAKLAQLVKQNPELAKTLLSQ